MPSRRRRGRCRRAAPATSRSCAGPAGGGPGRRRPPGPSAPRVTGTQTYTSFMVSAATSGARTKAFARPRDYVGVKGPDAADLLQRLLSNDVLAAESCEALILTPKGRVVAPLVVWRRGEDDFLLLTEPGLGDTVRSHLARMRFASKCEIAAEEHTSTVVLAAAAL